MASTTRLQQVLRIVAKKLMGRNYSVRVEKHRLIEDTEYLRLVVSCGRVFEIHIRKLIVAGKVARYSYQLLHGNETVLKYNNAPHHPEVETRPHHRHREGKIYPLHDYSLEAFLDEAMNIVSP